MSTTLKEQAWQSGLFLSKETAQWNENDWPPLEGGWRDEHATVVLDHPDTDNDNNNKRQTVVVLGGYQVGQGSLDSILVLNVAAPDKHWREGQSMNKSRRGHAAVGCNGGVYVIGGYNGRLYLDCIERIDVKDLLRSSSTSSTTQESPWTTLTCRLSTGRFGCCAAVVHNRYIAVMGGSYNHRYLSSVDIIDTSNDAVIAGPSMTAQRQWCASAVIGHRIFVVGGRNENGQLDSVEYLNFAEERKDDSLSTVISFSSSWITHSDLVLPNPRAYFAMVAVGSCLIVGGGSRQTVEVLDTHHHRVWNLPPLVNHREDCTMVTVANKVAVIGGWKIRSCATLPLIDKNTWCFRRLCEQQPNRWYHSLEGLGIRDDDISPFSTSTLACKRARSDTHRGDEGTDENLDVL